MSSSSLARTNVTRSCAASVERVTAAETQPTGRGSRAYGEGREALLAAAVRVVATKGLRHLTYRAVAQEAGVTHGLVTHHFGSRDALIESALQYSLDNSVAGMTTAPGSGRIEALFEGLTQLVADDPDTQAFQYELVLESRRRPELQPAVKALYDGYRAALREEFAHIGIGTAEPLVQLVFAALDGLVFQQVCGVNSTTTDDALARLREIITLLEESRAS
jgi:TetR/AcrR family transcriptional regulator, regulator of biofilm formation and stress response